MPCSYFQERVLTDVWPFVPLFFVPSSTLLPGLLMWRAGVPAASLDHENGCYNLRMEQQMLAWDQGSRWLCGSLYQLWIANPQPVARGRKELLSYLSRCYCGSPWLTAKTNPNRHSTRNSWREEMARELTQERSIFIKVPSPQVCQWCVQGRVIRRNVGLCSWHLVQTKSSNSF